MKRYLAILADGTSIHVHAASPLSAASLTMGTRAGQRAGGVAEVRIGTGKTVWQGPVIAPEGAPYDHKPSCREGGCALLRTAK